MNGCEKITGELVVAGRDATKVLEAAEAALDDVASFVGPPVEAMTHDAVGFVWNDGLCSTLGDFGAERIAVVAFVSEKRTHRRCFGQYVGRNGNIGVLAWRQVQNDGSALRIAQSVDFRRASAARSADGLSVLPPFPPEAQR